MCSRITGNFIEGSREGTFERRFCGANQRRSPTDRVSREDAGSARSVSLQEALFLPLRHRLPQVSTAMRIQVTLLRGLFRRANPVLGNKNLLETLVLLWFPERRYGPSRTVFSAGGSTSSSCILQLHPVPRLLRPRFQHGVPSGRRLRQLCARRCGGAALHLCRRLLTQTVRNTLTSS